MRRRIQAVPMPVASSSFGIGVSLTPIAAQPAQAGGAPAVDIGGPYVFEGLIGTVDIPPELSVTCTWVVLITGVSSADVITWELETGNNFGETTPAYGTVVDVGVLAVAATSYETSWIVVTATVNGVAYPVQIGIKPGEDGNAACAF